MKLVFCIGTVFLCFLITTVTCQENESGSNFWDRMKELIRNFTDTVKNLWKEFTNEVSSRTKDMQAWTTEMMDAFKSRMSEWISSRPNLSNSEKEDMETYIEKLKLPEDKSQ